MKYSHFSNVLLVGQLHLSPISALLFQPNSPLSIPDFTEIPSSTLTISPPTNASPNPSPASTTKSHLSLPKLPSLDTSKALRGTVTNSASTSFSDDAEFQRQCLNSTATFRRQHNAPDLSWNTTLVGFASTWSQRCQFRPSAGPFGETLSSGHDDVSSSIAAWAAQESKYWDLAAKNGSSSSSSSNRNDWSDDFGLSGLFNGLADLATDLIGLPLKAFDASQFAQLVWKNSTQLGCARTNCAGQNGVLGWYVVCEFSPRGNVLGKYADNVQAQTQGGSGSGLIGNGNGKGGNDAPGSKSRSGAGRRAGGNMGVQDVILGLMIAMLVVL